MLVTIFKSLWETTKPHYITIDDALERLNGKSRVQIEQLRLEADPERREKIKINLPVLLFSGKFTTREDKSLTKHSGFLVLDFDHIDNREFLKKLPYIYACWVSPSGDGVKALVKIGNNHRGHFKALQEEISGIDDSGINISRPCFESWDPQFYLNKDSDRYEKEIKEDITKVYQVSAPETDEEIAYLKVKRWAESNGEVFSSGSRNVFVMKMSAFMNRVGISQNSCELYLVRDHFKETTDFSLRELRDTVAKVYKKYVNQFGQFAFEKEHIVNQGVIVDNLVFDADIKIEDVILFSDVYEDLLKIREKGQILGETTHFNPMDEYFRWSRMSLNCFQGYGGVGKSTFLMFLMMLKSVKDGYKWAVFSPETYPPTNFYSQLLQMWSGRHLDKTKFNCMTDDQIKQGYEFVNRHFMFIYPDGKNHTHELILKRAQETILKYGVDSVVIDPFNMLDHSIRRAGHRSDEYLSEVFSDFDRFSKSNNIIFNIVAHPKGTVKNKKGGYDCPTVFDLAGGPVWNAKMHNILCYFRPHYFDHPSDPSGGPFSPKVEIHTQKIKLQPQNGKLGILGLTYDRDRYTYTHNGESPKRLEQEEPKYNPNIFTESRHQQTEEDAF